MFGTCSPTACPWIDAGTRRPVLAPTCNCCAALVVGGIAKQLELGQPTSDVTQLVTLIHTRLLFPPVFVLQAGAAFFGDDSIDPTRRTVSTSQQVGTCEGEWSCWATCQWVILFF